MADGFAASRGILDETDWRGFENWDDIAKGWPPLDSAVRLRGLASDNLPLVEAGLWHLMHDLVAEHPNVHPATAPAVRYVAALLTEPLPDVVLKSSSDSRLLPLRAHLLAWLEAALRSVNDASVRHFVELAGFSPIEHPDSPWHAVRQVRPQVFDAVGPVLDALDPVVRRSALAVAVMLVQDAGLEDHRERVAAGSSRLPFGSAGTDRSSDRWCSCFDRRRCWSTE
ncbi:hypothetical protein ACFO1B_04350 [Dactylosporangium siamense]|uniref:Uncharacterized protein n=1 Tax=Dactylosporangium siamense TaxID=685454 RepID=A0A919U5Y8_9ACTN|nr:hypothetical protein [Dactylosporangium siamense]GIG42882.1 hypothetical protein Dsi01nite_009230 [Dactylosporangium siamense]